MFMVIRITKFHWLALAFKLDNHRRSGEGGPFNMLRHNPVILRIEISLDRSTFHAGDLHRVREIVSRVSL